MKLFRKKGSVNPDSGLNAINTEHPVSNKSKSRREILKGLAALPAVALLPGINNIYSPEVKSDITQDLKALTGPVPSGKLGKLNVSRMILGCNMIISHAHARDLIYTDSLIKNYYTEDKIFRTLQLAEAAGVNTIVNVTEAMDQFNKYKKEYNSKMQAICMATLPKNDLFSNINLCRDKGASAIYVHGRVCDAYVKEGKYDELAKVFSYIQSLGFQAGVGAHCLETVEWCEKEGFNTDFYMKAFHHDKYWSALPEENREQYIEIGPSFTDHNKYCDNMWDLHPNRTVEVMKNVKKPFIAFKTLAAGAIRPKDGFRYAFENGADFVCVGMFDFQVIENANTLTTILGDLGKRQREWFS
ncbi:MAG TPA: hypothetical protein VK213_12490 [Bacteroidales bacterium]|nr:hypothetical protein [Bacteroidales bacterium]